MNGFGWLAREAIADALRRRIAAAVALAALVSVVMLESCTSCSPSITMNGELRELSELVGPAACGACLVAPLGARLAGFAGIVLEQPQVADGLRDGLLGLGDVVGEVPDQLIKHLLRVFRRVEDRVDVRPDQLPDAPEDRGLCHCCLPVVDRR